MSQREQRESNGTSGRSIKGPILANEVLAVGNEELLATLVADVEDYAILLLDPAGRVLSWNAGAKRIKGYSSEEIIGKHYSAFYPAKDVEAGKPSILLIMAAETGRVEDEGWRVRRDGSLFWANVVITAIRNDDGNLLGFGKVTRDLTERRAAELDMQASEALRDGVLNAAIDYSIIGTDVDGTITLFNAGAERMLGYRADEVVGVHTPEIFHDETEVAARARELGVKPGMDVFIKAALRGESETREFTYLRKDGSRLPVELTVTAIGSSGSDPTGFIGIARDITVEKQALAAANDAERRWRTLLDHLPDMSVLVVDADLHYRVAVGAGLVNQGLGDVTGKPLSETTSSANAEMMTGLVKQAFAGVEATADMYSNATGQAHEVAVVPLPPHDGRPEALIVARDVSAARAREQQLAKAEERFRRLFNDAPNGIAVTAADGRIEQVNPALCALVGHSADSLVNQPLQALDGGPTDSFMADLVTSVSCSPTGRTAGIGQITHDSGHLVDVSVDVISMPGIDGTGQLLLNMVDFSERRRYEQKLAHLADHDPLTGLGNRRLFDAELDAHLTRCLRYGAKGALLMLDLDNFKQVNDTLGHGAGDQLLISIANLVRKRLRASDVFARLGGDEFAVLLPDADACAARAVATDLVALIRENAATLDGKQHHGVTASIGIVMIDRAEMSASELLANADVTMYDAKDAGRDQTVFFDGDAVDAPRTGANLLWADRIQIALEDDRFVLLAQPIINLVTNKITGAELLIRMVDDDGQLIAPGEFLCMVEKLGLATRLDSWVCDHAISIMEDIHRLDPEFYIEVNLSGQSVGNPRLAAAIGTRLSEAAIDPTKLIFEITETAAIANIEKARVFAEEIKRFGCRFALDDFGAGFGSFYYLKHLPFDYIKIDGEFVTHCATDPTDRLILSSIVEIARGLGHTTIAEFVSDAAILDIVREHGIDLAQGYYIGLPQPIEKLTSLIAANNLAATVVPSPRAAVPRTVTAIEN